MRGLSGSNAAQAWTVELRGIRPLLFDRYSGDNKAELPLEERSYLGPVTKAGRGVFLPTENLMSFLTAVNTTSAPKRLLDQRRYMGVCAALSAFCLIEPDPLIPLLREGKQIFFNGFSGGLDRGSGITEHHATARLPKGIPNPKHRPLLPLPWSLQFTVILANNQEVKPDLLKDLFVGGGFAVGLGTFRPRYGRFEVAKWEEQKS